MHPYVRLTRARRVAAFLVATPLLIAGCSDSGSKSTTAGSSSSSSSAGTSAATTTCTPKAGKDLVVLADDKQSQASDNIIPIATTAVAKPPLTDALNKVSAALSQDALVGLNRAVSSDGATPADAAKQFISDNKLTDGLSGGSGSITIGTQAFSEANVLGAVYQQVLQAAGYKATARQVGTRDLLEPAVQKGEIQVVPEYAASLTQFLVKKYKTKEDASADINKTVATLKPLAARAGFVPLTPSVATDQNAFAVTKATADAYSLKTFSDVASKCASSLTFGAGANCPANPFCSASIKKAYGVDIQLKPLDYDGPLTRKALQQGRILVGEVFSADADLVKAG